MIAPQMVSVTKEALRAGSFVKAGKLEPDLLKLQARIVISLFLIAAVLATVSCLALCLDGSYYMYTMADQGHSLAPHGRFGTSIIQLPPIWTLHLSGSLKAAVMVFCAVYALFPVTSLFSAWLMVRTQAPAMIIWPAIAIGMTSIFAQSCLISENLICCQLAWAVFFGTLFPGGPYRTYSAILLAGFLASLHPVSVVFLMASAVLPVVLMCFRIKLKRSQVVVALSVFLIALLKLASFYISSNVYEHDSLDWKITKWYLEHGLSGFPLVTGVLSLVAGLLVVVSSVIVSTKFGARVTGPRFSAFTTCTSVYLCLGGGVCAIAWCLDLKYWEQILPFGRFLCVPFGIFMFLCLCDAIMKLKMKERPQDPFRKTRFALTCLAGLFFLAATAIQCVEWTKLMGRLQYALVSSKAAILCLEEEKSLSDSSLTHWTSTYLSVLLQGRSPEKLLLPAKTIREAEGHAPFKLANWEKPSYGNWFKLPREMTK